MNFELGSHAGACFFCPTLVGGTCFAHVVAERPEEEQWDGK